MMLRISRSDDACVGPIDGPYAAAAVRSLESRVGDDGPVRFEV